MVLVLIIIAPALFLFIHGMGRGLAAMAPSLVLLLILFPLAYLNAKQLFIDPADVIVFSPQGMLDRRMVKDPVPWSHIIAVEELIYQRRYYVNFRMTQDGMNHVNLTKPAKFGHRFNKIVAGAGFQIQSAGAKINHEQLLHISQLYHTQHSVRST